MPTKPLPQLTAWSFSRLNTWERCKLLAKLKFIDKLKEPPAPAMERGSEIHKEAELFSTGKTRKRPKSLDCFAEEFKELRQMKKHLHVEQQLALNAKWEPCDWFGKDAWMRAVIDCYYIKGDSCVVIDYKTGRVNPDSLQQLGLYAIVIFANHPEVKHVQADLWFLDHGEIMEKNFAREHIDREKKAWAKRAKPMLADRTFKATPGDACRWCNFSAAKGGPCKF